LLGGLLIAQEPESSSSISAQYSTNMRTGAQSPNMEVIYDVEMYVFALYKVLKEAKGDFNLLTLREGDFNLIPTTSVSQSVHTINRF
jgi:hypothetical protein